MKKLINSFLNPLGYKAEKNKGRGMLQYLQRENRKDLIGIEIGVFKGLNAKHLFEGLDIKKLYLIDPYEYGGDDGSGSYYNREELINIRENMKIFLNKFKDKWVLIEKGSDEAVKEFETKVDFVYIDGDHSYNQVKKDIENYWKIVKNGGVLGGHDIENLFYKENGVTKAVIEFVIKNDLNLIMGHKDWIICK